MLKCLMMMTTNIISLIAGINRKVTYSLEGSSIFLLDRETGILSVTQTLDRETRAMYNLTVTATDHGTPPLSTRTNILVLVSGKFFFKVGLLCVCIVVDIRSMLYIYSIYPGVTVFLECVYEKWVYMMIMMM